MRSDDICTTVLEHGLPADNGIRPHINITVDTETLKAMADDQARKTLDLDLKPATLRRVRTDRTRPPHPPALRGRAHPIPHHDVGKNLEVLDVGRTERLATPRQAKAISLRQGGTCAAPACWHPISHNHHLTWWSHGGRTDLDNLIGLCRTCHTLVHSGRLELARGSPHQALAA